MINKKAFLLNLMLLILFSIVSQRTFSQSTSDSLNQKEHYIAIFRTHFGYVMPHREAMQHLTTDHFTAFELSVEKQTFGKKEWHQLYKYPQIGISLWHSQLANSPTLGNATAIFPYINFPLVKGKVLNFNFRFGTGLGYLSKCFDRTDNYKNIAIGSHLNAHFNLLFDLKLRVSSNINFSAGFDFAHFSNGAFKIPNLGINVPTLNLSLSYLFNKTPIKYIKHELLPITNKNEYLFVVNTGLKEIYPIGGKKFPVFDLSLGYNRKINHKSKIGLGLDFFYISSNLQSLKSDTTFNQKNKYQIIRPGINLAYELLFSKLSLIIQMGGYIYARDNSDGYFYNRLSLRYPVYKNIFLNLALKTHFAKADFIELGIGYKF